MDDRLFQFHEAAKPRLLERHEDQPTHAPMRAGIKPADRRAPSTDQKKVRRSQQRKTATVGVVAAVPNAKRDPDDLSGYCLAGEHEECEDFAETTCLCQCHDHWGVPDAYKTDWRDDQYHARPFNGGAHPSYEGSKRTAGFGSPGDPTQYGVGGDHCPHCGADWKQPHDGDCLRNTNPSQAAALEAEGEKALAAENAAYDAAHPEGNVCPVCDGSGMYDSTFLSNPDGTCKNCGGTGRVGGVRTGALSGNPKVVQVPSWAADSQGSTYDWTQTSDDIKDGDVFVGQGFTGFLMKAWPILVSGPDEGVLHGVEGGDLDATVAKWKAEGDDYGPSLALARQQKTGALMTDGSLWDDLESGDTSKQADFSWYNKKPGDIADSSGQGVSGLPDANKAEKEDCGAKDGDLVCVRPKNHDGVHDFQPVQGESQKAAAYGAQECEVCGKAIVTTDSNDSVRHWNAEVEAAADHKAVKPKSASKVAAKGEPTKDDLLAAQRVLRSLSVGDNITVMKDGRELAMVVTEPLQGQDFAINPGGGYDRIGAWESAAIKARVTGGAGQYSATISVSQQARKQGMPFVKEGSKTAGDQYLYRYDSGQPGGVRRVSGQWRTKECSPGGSGDCTGYEDDSEHDKGKSRDCECWCHGEEAMDLLSGVKVEGMKAFHEEYIWPRGKPSYMASLKTAADDDWSGGWARPAGSGQGPSMWGTRILPDGTEVRLYRGPNNHVRFYDAQGGQHGEEQGNVAPAFAYAESEGWHDPNSVRNTYGSKIVAGQSSTECPKCGAAISPVQIKGDDGHTLLKGKCDACGWKGKKIKPKESAVTTKTAGQDLPFMDWYRIVQHAYNALTGSYLEADIDSTLYHRAHEEGWAPEKAIQAFCGKFGKAVSLMDAMQAVDRAGQHHKLWAAKHGARSDYAHWNEEQDSMWWQEEGRHSTEPDPDDFYDDRGGADYPEDDPDDDDDDDDYGDPRIPESQLSAARKESSMNPSQREAQILRAMAKATPAEQKDLAIELEALRTAARAHRQEERDLDWANGVIRDTLTPVATHQHNSSATDWIADIGTESSYSDQVDHQVRAEATLWYQRTGSEVAEFDPEEFLEQAMGMARRTASLCNDTTGRAERSFVEHACHLAGLKISFEQDVSASEGDWPLNPEGQQPGPDAEHRPDNWPITSPEGQTTGDSADTAEIPGVTSARDPLSMWDAIEIVASPGPGDADDSGKGVSSLPAEIPLDGHTETMDNFQPPVAPINEGIAYNEPTSADAPIVQENMQDPPETSGGGGNAGQVADPSGQAVSGLPTPNAAKTAKDGDTGTCAICGKPIEQQDYAWYHLSKDGPVNWEEHGPETYPKNASLHTAEDNGGAQTCSVCGDTITRDPEGESPRTYHHTNGTSHDHEASPKSAESSLHTAAEPVADESGSGVSGLPQVEDTVEETMWEWELDANTPGTGAADVAAVPTPGGETGYPQPKGAAYDPSNLTPAQAAFRQRVQSSLRG